MLKDRVDLAEAYNRRQHDYDQNRDSENLRETAQGVDSSFLGEIQRTRGHAIKSATWLHLVFELVGREPRCSLPSSLGSGREDCLHTILCGSFFPPRDPAQRRFLFLTLTERGALPADL